MGHIAFWHCRFGVSAAERVRRLWRSFPSVEVAAAVLFDAVHGNVMIEHSNVPIDFVSVWPIEICSIAEAFLTSPKDAPTLVPRRRNEVAQFLIKTLGMIGTERSLTVLRQFVDDPEFGAPALNAIAAIQQRIAATPA